MIHKDILIVFEINGIGYEAIGFIEDGEESCSIREACRRAGERVITSGKDCERIFRNQRQLPQQLIEFDWLLTARGSEDCPDIDVLFFGQRAIRPRLSNDLSECFDEWGQTWPCTERTLILRRSE